MPTDINSGVVNVGYLHKIRKSALKDAAQAARQRPQGGHRWLAEAGKNTHSNSR